MNTPTTSPFLALPREIRDEIYHESFNDTQYMFKEESLALTISYNGRTWRGGRLPGWLFSCRQLLSEGLKQFYSQATCTYFDIADERRDRSSSFLSLSNIERIDGKDNELDLAEVLRLEMGYDTGVHRITFDRSRRNRFWILRNYLKTHDCRLKDFAMELKLPFDLDILDSLIGVKVDLSALADIGTGLERVELVILEPMLSPAWPNEIEKNHWVYQMVQEELEKEAIGLICGVQHKLRGGCIIKDWMRERIEDHRSLQHNWHIECRTGSSEATISKRKHVGMEYWGDNFASGYHHYKLLRGSGGTGLVWYCEKAERRVLVKGTS